MMRHVILTRPRIKSGELFASLNEAGFAAIELPMLEVVPLSSSMEAEARQKWFDITGKQDIGGEQSATGHSCDIAIFISTNAVSFAAEFFHKHSLNWLDSIASVGIGSATCELIIKQGWPLLKGKIESLPTELVQQETSEALLMQPWAQQVAGKSIVIFRGVGGRELLAEQLRVRGANVNSIELYQRHKPEYDSETLSAVFKRIYSQTSAGVQPIAICASGETLLNFCDYIEQVNYSEYLPQTICIVPSQRVAEMAQQRGFGQVNVSNNASNAAFLRCVLALS